ncbi:MAG TPA: PEP/pyruvate-binding domain-containing protein, partial [Candidatus Limnocylindria bacterium]|nr:PEP/pyruvate-binding domain-containing protein [Candidatus Limnocylindria bacterium]
VSPAAYRPLADVRLTDAASVGGKAASLGELIAAGVRVPDGVVLVSDHVDDALVREATATLGTGPYAVRSSGASEDGAEHSFAGMYESVLNVPPTGLTEAVERVLGSARAARVDAYGAGANGHVVVLIQRMVAPVAAGVALTADPVTGDRASCIVTAVNGLGDRLASGEAAGDEWVVIGDRATARRRSEYAIREQQAVAVAGEARRIAAARGVPQDVEWAIDKAGAIWILQARPMTALPEVVSWASPAAGGYSRSFRFGEWIGAPVTPLFESWLLSTLEVRLHAQLREWIGQRAPLPHHVTVNGWYFYSLNWIAPRNMLRSLPSILAHAIREPRMIAGIIPPLVHHAYPVMERAWRTDLQPRYRAAVAAADARIDTARVADLPVLIDELADRAGEYFASLVALAGAAYKAESNLARFYRAHLVEAVGPSHLPLVAGLVEPTGPAAHAVTSLDWVEAPTASPAPATDHDRQVAARRQAESAAREALDGNPRRLARFEQLLYHGQHLVPIREEQVAEWTLPWPIMRRAVVRIGQALAERGAIGQTGDVFFLTRDEALAALAGRTLDPSADPAARRATRERQSRLAAPLRIGRMHPALERFFERAPKGFGATRSDRAIVAGVPASTGRVTGSVRVIRGPDDFDTLLEGEILVAPVTAPAWTPLFTRAAAVVTDVGSPAAHASIIAREYGIPAVVGCGDATARLRTGMVV